MAGAAASLVIGEAASNAVTERMAACSSCRRARIRRNWRKHQQKATSRIAAESAGA
jgi:hypothetical protein